jgi:hypothetical protein
MMFETIDLYFEYFGALRAKLVTEKIDAFLIDKKTCWPRERATRRAGTVIRRASPHSLTPRAHRQFVDTFAEAARIPLWIGYALRTG